METRIPDILHSLRSGEDTRSLIRGLVETNARPYRELMAYYRCALMEVQTKFNVLNEELSLEYDHNPIESIQSRIKSPQSILDKMERRGVLPTVDAIEQNLNDVAGIRVICSYTSDIYKLADALLRQDDLKLVERKDYIASPKENGYRSLHLVVEVPIFLYRQKKMMKVEVQLRTMAMDWWASLEHKIRYKKDIPEDIEKQVAIELRECAESAALLDRKMEQINLRVDHMR